MATLGSLLVRIGADTREMERGLQRSSDRLKSFSDNANRIGRRMLRLTAGFAAVGAGAFALAVRTGNLADALLDLSDQTGLSTDSLQQFRRVATRAGVDVDTVANATMYMQRRMAMAGEEGGKAAETMGKLGVHLHDAAGGMRSMDAVVPEVIRALQGIDDVTRRNALAIQIFGRQATNLAPILGMATDEFDALARSMDGVHTREQLERANQFRVRWDELRQSLGFSAQELGMSLLPLMTEFVELIDRRIVPAVREFVQRLDALSPATRRNVAIFGALTAAIAPLILTLGMLARAMAAVTAAMATMRAGAVRLLPFLGPKGWLVLGVGALATGLMGASKAFRDTRTEADRYIDSLGAMDRAQLEAQRSALLLQQAQILEQRDRHEPGSRRWDERNRALAQVRTAGIEVSRRLEEMDRQAVDLKAILADAVVEPFEVAASAVDELQSKLDRLMSRAGQHAIPITLQGLIPSTDQRNERVAREQERAAKALLEAGMNLQAISMRPGGLTGGMEPASVSPLQRAMSAAGTLGERMLDLARAFNPLQFALRFVSAAFEAAAPAVEALMAPVEIIARAFGTALAPALQAIEPVLRAVAIGFTWLGEAVAFAAQIVTRAFGSVAVALGRFINAITPFASPGNPIIRMGESILAFSDAMGEAADGFADARRQLRAGVDETTESLRRFNDQLLNAPRAFNLALLRHQAGTGGVAPGGSPGGGGDLRDRIRDRREERHTYNITITGADKTARELFDEVEAEVQRRRSRGGTTRLELAMAS